MQHVRWNTAGAQAQAYVYTCTHQMYHFYVTAPWSASNAYNTYQCAQ